MPARPTRGFPLGSLLATALLALPAGATLGGFGMPAILLAQTAPGAPEAPKQVVLTQAKIDNLIAAQKKIQEVEGKAGAPDKDGAKPAAGDQADAKTQKQVEGIITSSGFATMKDFADTMYSVGIVLSGIDPDGSDYIGTVAALKKEQDEVKADKKMSPSEKKEVLDEIAAGIKNAPSEKPLPGNVEVVKANMSKLDQAQKPD